MRVVGVDGYRGGWVAAAWDVDVDHLALRVHASFAELLAAHDEAAVIGVDMPIGLPDNAPRACDRLARQLLGPRRASVFSAPCRALLGVSDYAAALALSRRLTGRGLSLQTFHLLPKIAEVDAALQAGLAMQGRIAEVHPELAFTALNGGVPLAHAKRRPEGFAARRALLAAALPHGAVPAVRSAIRMLAPGAAPDDVLDALAVAWSANRVARGTATRLPATPEHDATGLRMEIVY